MNKDIHLHYTEDLTKLSVLYYCWAMTGKLFALSVVFIILGLIFLIQYDGSPMVVSMIVFTLIWVTCLLSLLYYITRKRALAKFRSLKDGKAIFGITDDHFSLIGTGVTSTLPWSSIAKIKQYPDFWIILLRPRGYFTLPLHNLLPEDKEFILKQVK
ncbi:MAG: hypothetical protein A3B66_08775 [Alphaproteobacteria bacterium RIFCSPHIGHO2_02_FULL_46_13]|nr:MAG: hypothetical protein A3B66_08775 [Alphaproteobacteria bacterium RIFCSPHIGHO2_02_FULL_46_13]